MEWERKLEDTDKLFDPREVADAFRALSSRNQDLALARLDLPERVLLLTCLALTERPNAPWGPISKNFMGQKVGKNLKSLVATASSSVS